VFASRRIRKVPAEGSFEPELAMILEILSLREDVRLSG